MRRLGTLGGLAKGSGGSKEDNRDDGLPIVRYGELYTRFETVIDRAHSFIAPEAVPRYTPLPANTIVFAASGEDREDIGKSALSLIEMPAYVGGDTVLFTPNSVDSDPLYLAYVLESRPLKALKAIRSTGFTVVHISVGRLKTLPVPLPPLAEQRAIADYLDRETAQIDELITEQQRLIELFAERRSAAAATVLGPRIGAGGRLKWFITEADVRAGDRALDLPLLSVSISWGVRRREEVFDDEARAADFTNYKVCEAGDLVVNKMRAFQGALGLATEDGLVSPDYAVLRTTPEVEPGWLVAAMTTSGFVAEMAKRVKGIGSADLGNARTPRINVADLGEIRLDLPGLAQQAFELSGLKRRVSRIDRLVGEAERLIALAKERRAALITAAVTGQIDVCAAA